MTSAKQPTNHVSAHTGRVSGGAFVQACLWIGGCGVVGDQSAGVLLTAPLSVNGQSVGTAVVDTGGNYELLLREDFGLDIVGSTEVLALNGRERLGLARDVPYVAGGVEGLADAAIIGLTLCNCNGLGIDFLRKYGVVFGVDFLEPEAMFLTQVPEIGIEIPFSTAPQALDGFDTSFIEVTLRAGGNKRTVVGLLDTGATGTLMRRGAVGGPPLLSPNRMFVRISHEQLGTISLRVSLFEIGGLPTIILGTDAMEAWADRWYIRADAEGGTVTAVRDQAVPAARF